MVFSVYTGTVLVCTYSNGLRLLRIILELRTFYQSRFFCVLYNFFVHLNKSQFQVTQIYGYIMR